MNKIKSNGRTVINPTSLNFNDLSDKYNGMTTYVFISPSFKVGQIVTNPTDSYARELWYTFKSLYYSPDINARENAVLERVLKPRIFSYDGAPNNPVTRIIFDSYNDSGFTLQKIEFIPGCSFTLFRMGKKNPDGTYTFGPWNADNFHYTHNELNNYALSKNYMDRKYVKKSDVKDFYESILRYKGREYNPNNCKEVGFYSFHNMITGAEYTNLITVFTDTTVTPNVNHIGPPIATGYVQLEPVAPTSSDIQNNPRHLLVGTIYNYDMRTSETIGGFEYKLMWQVYDALIQNYRRVLVQRLVKVRKNGDTIVDTKYTQWEKIN